MATSIPLESRVTKRAEVTHHRDGLVQLTIEEVGEASIIHTFTAEQADRIGAALVHAAKAAGGC